MCNCELVLNHNNVTLRFKVSNTLQPKFESMVVVPLQVTYLFCIMFVVLLYVSSFREESIILWCLAIFHLYLYMSSIWICLICEYVLYLIMTPFIQPTIHHGWSESFNRKHYQDLKHWTMRHVVSSLIHSWEVSKHCHNWFLAVWLVDIIVKDLCYSTTPFSTHQKYSTQI